MSDQYLAVRNYSIDNRELEADKLKDVKFEVDKLVLPNITSFIDFPTQQYQTRGHVYHLGRQAYVQIKKYDEARKIYVVRAKDEVQPASTSLKKTKSDQGVDVECTHEEISDQIEVKVRVLTSDNQLSGFIQVGIHEKIANLKDYFGHIKNSGSLTSIYNEEIVKADDTFFKRQIKYGESFLLISGAFEAKKWKRFNKIEPGDYFYMSDTYYDAIIFKPKMDVYYLGFGFTNQYEKKDFKIKFKHNIDGQDMEEKEVEITQDMLGQDGFFEVDYQKLGIQPVAVK